MRRVHLVALCLSLGLSACMPAFLQQTVNPTPLPNLEATAAALAATMAVQTLQAMPSPALAPSETAVILPVSSNTAAASPTASWTATLPGGTGTPGTTATPIMSVTPAGPTSTLHAQFFGTRPPLVPSGRLLLMNRSHAQAYVSFQCINMKGSLTILEYPVTRWMELKFPSGKCDYVAWVGGREFVGKFALDTGGQRTIIFYIDRIKIK
ncbi:MAG: hypothetical protein ACM3QS_17185 [Bacteroidota bacterium]